MLRAVSPGTVTLPRTMMRNPAHTLLEVEALELVVALELERDTLLREVDTHAAVDVPHPGENLRGEPHLPADPRPDLGSRGGHHGHGHGQMGTSAQKTFAPHGRGGVRGGKVLFGVC